MLPQAALLQAAKNDDEKEEKETVNAGELKKQVYKRFKSNKKLMKILKSLPQEYKEYLEHVHTDAQSAEFLSQIPPKVLLTTAPPPPAPTPPSHTPPASPLQELAAFTHGAHKQADKNSQIAQRLLHKCKEHMRRLKELSKDGRTDHEEVEALEVTQAERDKYIARFTYFRKLMLAGVVAFRLLEEVGSLKARTKELEKELKRANDTAEADWLRLAADKSELEQERQGLEQEPRRARRAHSSPPRHIDSFSAPAGQRAADHHLAPLQACRRNSGAPAHLPARRAISRSPRDLPLAPHKPPHPSPPRSACSSSAC